MPEPILTCGVIFDLSGRGPVIAGRASAAWNTAKNGETIELRSPNGSVHRTTIIDMLPLGSKLDAWLGLPYKGHGILLPSTFTHEDAQAGIEVWRVDDNAA